METAAYISDENLVLFWPSLIGVMAIALAHLFAPRFRFLHKPDNIWVPMSAGIALAYVFMDIFPHLAKSKANFGYVGVNPIYELLARNIYLVALIGFAVYLGIVLAEMAFRKDPAAREITFREAPVFIKIEYLSLAAYNFLIGYLIAEQVTHRAEPAVLFAIAMAVHFAGLDYLARGHFPKVYDDFMRYASAAAVLAGWVSGVVVEITNASLDIWYSFLAGGIIVIAAVYELPHIHTQRQYWAFVVGAALFSLLILSIGYIGK
ncbi:MAG: hypothetical protein KJO76_05820 [Gammaproteobacteria bacterium]|nr:hypothetical protein [Gammaproteobacteria bacterium]